MPLVPSSVFSAWYRRDSAVYRNFAFLFVNPLWQKSIPGGFSLCPLFWLSLFSFAIFRPFVYLLLGVHAVLKWLHLERIIPFTDKVATMGFKVLFGLTLTSSTSTFMPTMLALIWALAMVMFPVSPILCYHEAGLMSLILIPLAAAYITFRCLVYEGQCNVRVYPPLAAGLSAIALGFAYPHEMATVLFHYPVVAFLGTLHGLSVAALWVFHLVKAILFWGVGSALIAIVAVGVVTLIGGIGYYTTGYGVFPAPSDIPSKERKRIAERLAWLVFSNDGTFHFTEKRWLSIVRDMPQIKSFTSYDQTLYHPNVEPFIVAAMMQGQIEHDRMTAADHARAARKARRDAACQRVTSQLAKVLSPVTTVLKHVGIFCVYLWEMVKARKSKSCPYLRFTDPS